MDSMWQSVVRRLRFGTPVVVVSGLPRSGTSMAMKMLEAAGLGLVVDDVRTADEDNPRGYYEDERVKSLADTRDKHWLRHVRGKAIKVVSSLLNHLPPDNFYKTVFMRRDLHEVLASQAKMLQRRGEPSHTDDAELLRMYESHLEKAMFQLRFRPNFEALYVNYTDVIDDPLGEARRIADFIGGLDPEVMAGVVDGSLYRNRRAEGDADPVAAAGRSGAK